MNAAVGANVVCLADVQAERVTWLWPGRLPLGKLVVLDGDPGVGKSTITAAITATVSTGSTWPDGAQCPIGNVLILSAEDGLGDTIKPRLEAAGADPGRVHALTSIPTTTESGEKRFDVNPELREKNQSAKDETHPGDHAADQSTLSQDAMNTIEIMRDDFLKRTRSDHCERNDS